LKRNHRLTAVVVIVILLIFLFFTMVKPSLDQNDELRQFIAAVLITMQRKDIRMLKQAYVGAGLTDDYVDQIKKSSLLGWKIQSIDSQPYPMDTGSSKVTVELELYYRLPDSMIQPKGPYQVGNFPPYNNCIRYHTACHLHFERSLGVIMLDAPSTSIGTDLLVPMPREEKQKTAPGPKKK